MQRDLLLLYPVPCRKNLHMGSLERSIRCRILVGVGRMVHPVSLAMSTTTWSVGTLPSSVCHRLLQDDRTTSTLRSMKQ